MGSLKLIRSLMKKEKLNFNSELRYFGDRELSCCVCEVISFTHQQLTVSIRNRLISTGLQMVS